MMNVHLPDVSDLHDYIKYIIKTHDINSNFSYSCLNQYN